MPKKFYITTPIYYVNAAPHIGHSYTTIAADALARQMRHQLGEKNVWFLTGTDEHGQKIQRAAEEAGQQPQEFVDKVVLQFKSLWDKLKISCDDFIRTTEERHIQTVQAALQLLQAKGLVYSDRYEGWYCTPCETFWSQNQLAEGLCPDCHRPLEKIKETNYFFKLSLYQEWLVGHIKAHPHFILPQNRRNEVLSFLKNNRLCDLCISRPKERLSWGIALPFSAGHVTYVWFDALINYLSAVGRFSSDGSYVSEWWDAQTQVVHLVGKDILRQHAIYWPIILNGLGIRPADTVFAHGWWLLGEDKMSKSRGNVVSPLALTDKYGTDTYRYFLLRDVPFGLDGNFSEEAIIKRFNADLANDLGNLVHRSLTMVEKYYGGVVPQEGRPSETGKGILEKAAALKGEILLALAPEANFNFSAALEDIWRLINLANKYVEQAKPWELQRNDKQEELKGFVRLLVDTIRQISEAIYPFMPSTSAAILQQLSKEQVSKGSPLFPRIETR